MADKRISIGDYRSARLHTVEEAIRTHDNLPMRQLRVRGWQLTDQQILGNGFLWSAF